MNDRKKWRERVRDIRATSTTWWWWIKSKYHVTCYTGLHGASHKEWSRTGHDFTWLVSAFTVVGLNRLLPEQVQHLEPSQPTFAESWARSLEMASQWRFHRRIPTTWGPDSAAPTTWGPNSAAPITWGPDSAAPTTWGT